MRLSRKYNGNPQPRKTSPATNGNVIRTATSERPRDLSFDRLIGHAAAELAAAGDAQTRPWQDDEVDPRPDRRGIAGRWHAGDGEPRCPRRRATPCRWPRSCRPVQPDRPRSQMSNQREGDIAVDIELTDRAARRHRAAARRQEPAYGPVPGQKTAGIDQHRRDQGTGYVQNAPTPQRLLGNGARPRFNGALLESRTRFMAQAALSQIC